jgi:hypothetical protein
LNMGNVSRLAWEGLQPLWVLWVLQALQVP